MTSSSRFFAALVLALAALAASAARADDGSAQAPNAPPDGAVAMPVSTSTRARIDDPPRPTRGPFEVALATATGAVVGGAVESAVGAVRFAVVQRDSTSEAIEALAALAPGAGAGSAAPLATTTNPVDALLVAASAFAGAALGSLVGGAVAAPIIAATGASTQSGALTPLLGHLLITTPVRIVAEVALASVAAGVATAFLANDEPTP